MLEKIGFVLVKYIFLFAGVIPMNPAEVKAMRHHSQEAHAALRADAARVAGFPQPLFGVRLFFAPILGFPDFNSAF